MIGELGIGNSTAAAAVIYIYIYIYNRFNRWLMCYRNTFCLYMHIKDKGNIMHLLTMLTELAAAAVFVLGEGHPMNDYNSSYKKINIHKCNIMLYIIISS
jgi:hypothetical protein